MFQVGPGPDGNPSPLYIIALLTTDTALLLGLMFAFMRRSNDRPAQLFLGWRPVASEVRVGPLTVPPILGLIVVVQLGLRAVAPSLHNVPISPFAGLMDSPWALAGFVVVLIIAGGLREELQRAFLLRRFEQQLGGAQRRSRRHQPGLRSRAHASGLGRRRRNRGPGSSLGRDVSGAAQRGRHGDQPRRLQHATGRDGVPGDDELGIVSQLPQLRHRRPPAEVRNPVVDELGPALGAEAFADDWRGALEGRLRAVELVAVRREIRGHFFVAGHNRRREALPQIRRNPQVVAHPGTHARTR